jgi:hypothetical protein
VVAEASRRGAAAVAAHATAWEPTTVEAVGGGARLVVRCQAQWVGAMSWHRAADDRRRTLALETSCSSRERSRAPFRTTHSVRANLLGMSDDCSERDEAFLHAVSRCGAISHPVPRCGRSKKEQASTLLGSAAFTVCFLSSIIRIHSLPYFIVYVFSSTMFGYNVLLHTCFIFSYFCAYELE